MVRAHASAPAPTPMVEIANRIRTHLVRFQNDPRVNVPDPGTTFHPYYFASAYYPRGSRYVHVSYVTYQGASKLTRQDAEMYLAWLDAGHIGKHFGLLDRPARMTKGGVRRGQPTRDKKAKAALVTKVTKKAGKKSGTKKGKAQ